MSSLAQHGGALWRGVPAKRLAQQRRRVENLVACVLLLLGILFYLLHFKHLRADFPNHSPWMDWAKYTDEGWYGDAAIRHYLRGRWRLPGDFNPAVALPVWPLLEGLVFRFTGVGIVAARALAVVVFGGILLAGFVLLDRPVAGAGAGLRRIFASSSVLLLSASSFAYAFSRIAIVEPLLILLTMCALLLAYWLRFATSRAQGRSMLGGLGVLVALMIATKTTAVFVLPAVGWMLWSSSGFKPRNMIRNLALTMGVAGALWGLYLTMLLHNGLFEDFRYLFAANHNTVLSRENFRAVLLQTFQDGIWMGSLLYPLGLLAVLAAVFRPRLWRDEVFTSLVLWAAGYTVFMAYHANFQPRYYLVIMVPLTLVLVRGTLLITASYRLALYALAPLLALVIAQESHRTLHFVMHPEYSFETAAQQIDRVVEAEPAHSHTVLSISGSTLSLMTGLPSICDDFGTMDLEDRIAAYRPGWFVTWNVVEDDKMEALARFYRLTRVAEFPAMDDPDRNVMIVYRLDLREGARPKRKRRGARSNPAAKYSAAVDAG